MRRFIPEPVKKILRPYYHRWQKKQKSKKWADLTTRDWSVDLGTLPAAETNVFMDSVLEGSLDYKINNDTLNVLLCGQPKSASLYITQLLSSTLGLTNHQIGFNHKGGRIYYPRLLAVKYSPGNTISHCHASPDNFTVKMIENLNLKPVVLTRNLLDTLVSRKDMLTRDGWSGELVSTGGIKAYMEGSEEYRMDVVIELYANSYLNFYSGWRHYEQKNELKPIFITYLEMLEDQTALVRKVADALGVQVQDDEIKNIVAKIQEAGGINLNKGVAGRGLQSVTPAQLQVLRAKVKMFACEDEEYLGFSIN